MGVVDDLYQFLEAEGLAGGLTGWALVRRRVHDEADQLVVLTEDGGPAPEIPAAQGIGDSALQDPGVHVLVRGEPWDGDASAAKAQEIIAALHGRLGAQIGATTYLRVRAQTPEPVFAGFDDRGRPSHTASFRFLTDA